MPTSAEGMFLPDTGDQAPGLLRKCLHQLVLKMSASKASYETLLLPATGDQALRLPEGESSQAGTYDFFLVKILPFPGGKLACLGDSRLEG